MFTAYHNMGSNPCFKPAFLYDHIPEEEEIIKAEYGELLDGSKPVDCEEIICGSCGKPIEVLNGVLPLQMFESATNDN